MRQQWIKLKKILVMGGIFTAVMAHAHYVPVTYGEQDVARLATALQRLEKYVYRKLGSTPSSDAAETITPSSSGVVTIDQAQVITLQEKLETLSQEFPLLLSRLEEAEHKIQTLMAHNEDLINRLAQFEQQALPSQEVVSSESIQPESVPNEPNLSLQENDTNNLSVEELEKKARAALFAAQHNEARDLFNKLLMRELTQEKEAMVHFYLGEIAHLQKQYAKAAEHYLLTYQKHPKGPKAPQSLLKLAATLHPLGKKKEACATLQKLLNDYPTAEETTLKLAQQSRREYMCKG